MKSYNIRLSIRLAWLILFAILTGSLIALEKYWAAGFSLIALSISLVYLVRFVKRSIKDIKRLISSIRFNEFNISFSSFTKKGLSPDLVPDMEQAIDLFNQRLKKLESQQHFYEILLSKINFAIMVIDAGGKIEWINKAALNLFDKHRVRKLYDLAHVSLSLPEELDLLIPHETKIIRFQQEKVHRQMAATALSFSLNGKTLKLISLQNIDSVLEESESDAWKKLIRVLTHEIMNSLSPIISLSETFTDPDDETKDLMPKAMQTIHRRSKGLIDFVNNYQKLTKIPPPVKTIFPVEDLLEDISQLLKPNKLFFTYSIEKENLMLNADRSQIEQVMINLIKNACESSISEIPTQVHVTANRDNYQRTLIQVEDNGQGILPEVLDKIFVPFFTTKSKGSGIGLSICRQIINLHGGSISVASEPEQGTNISIVLS